MFHYVQRRRHVGRTSSTCMFQSIMYHVQPRRHVGQTSTCRKLFHYGGSSGNMRGWDREAALGACKKIGMMWEGVVKIQKAPLHPRRATKNVHKSDCRPKVRHYISCPTEACHVALFGRYKSTKYLHMVLPGCSHTYKDREFGPTEESTKSPL